MNITNAIFDSCLAGNNGGAIDMAANGSAYSLTVTNATFNRNLSTGNQAYPSGSAIYNVGGSSYLLTLNNNIFYGNYTSPTTGQPSRFGKNDVTGLSNITYNYNLLDTTKSNGAATANKFNINGNLQLTQDSVHVFYNPNNGAGPDGIWRTSDDGFYLGSYSQAYNGGNNSYVSGITNDITENSARIQNSIVDMGAYEGTALSNPVSPGGVFGNLDMWNKANAGVSTSGSNVTAWIDQTGNNTFTKTGTPVLQSAPLNYNPTVLFDGASRFTGNTALANITQGFVVGKIVNSVGTASGAFIGSTSTNSFKYFFHTESNTVYAAGNVTAVYTGFSNGSSNNLGYSLLDEDLAKTPSTSDMIRLNGADQTNNVNSDPAIITSSTPTIGSRNTENLSSGSEIAEAILYSTNAVMSTANVNQIESYLAIKYGITLSNAGGGTNGNYASSTGTNVWNASLNSSYHNQVFGIARDDNSGLLQLQSHQSDDSTRIYLNTLASTNATNGGSFSSDQQFVMMGNNTGALRNSTYNMQYPSGQSIYGRLDREWQISNTNFTGTYSMDITLNTTPLYGTDLKVLIGSSSDLSTGTLYTPTINIASRTVTISGITNSMIPANSTRYMTLVSMNPTTPLQLQLLSFNAVPNGNAEVKLTWETAAETEGTVFIPQRSIDQTNWQDIGKVNGTGNENSSTNYSFIDANPFKGKSYYRLQEMDAGGKPNLSAIRMVNFDSLQNRTLSVYPNPTHGKIAFEGISNIPSAITVYDAIGRNLTQSVNIQLIGTNSAMIDLSKLPDGIYMIRAQGKTVPVQKR